MLDGVSDDKLIALLSEGEGRQGVLEMLGRELRRVGRAERADKYAIAAQRLADKASRQQEHKNEGK